MVRYVQDRKKIFTQGVDPGGEFLHLYVLRDKQEKDTYINEIICM